MRTFKGITNKQLEARENAGDQVTKASSFAFDWFRGQRELFRPITEVLMAKQTIYPERGKTRVTKSRKLLLLHLIG